MRKVIRRSVRRSGKGVNVAADVDAVVVSNVEPRERSGASRRQRVRIVQRRGRTWVFDGDESDEGS